MTRRVGNSAEERALRSLLRELIEPPNALQIADGWRSGSNPPGRPDQGDAGPFLRLVCASYGKFGQHREADARQCRLG
jgi:hypothetical protein